MIGVSKILKLKGIATFLYCLAFAAIQAQPIMTLWKVDEAHLEDHHSGESYYVACGGEVYINYQGGGSTEDVIISILNSEEATENLELTLPLTLDPSSAAVYDIIQQPEHSVIAPGQESHFIVRYTAPVIYHDDKASLVIESNDPVNGSCELNIDVGEGGGPPSFSKEFVPDEIGEGSTTTLTFTIDNSYSSDPVSDLAFMDVLPTNVIIATPANVSTTCTNAVISAPDGGGTISMTDGQVGAFSTCTVSVDVIGSEEGEGPYTNTTGDLTSSAGNSGSASAELLVTNDLPGFTKSFDPPSISIGQTSTLTFTLDNLNGSATDPYQFIDQLPAGMIFATPHNATTDCPNNPFLTINFEPGSNTLSMSTLTLGLDAEEECTVSVDVTTTTTGTFNNISDDLLIDGVPSGFASAVLDVPVEFLSKSFTNDPVAPGDVVNLEFTINNLDRDFPLTDIGFEDDLDPLGSLTGLAPSGVLPSDPCGAGSTLTFTSATGVLNLSGGTLPAAGSCTFSVDLLVPADAGNGTYTNTTTAITATINGDGVTGNTATDELIVKSVPKLTKEFIDDPSGAGGTTTLRFTLKNTDSDENFFDLAFMDDLETAIVGLAANSLVDGDTDDPMEDVCGDGSFLTVFNPPDIMLGMITIVTPPDPTILVFSGGILEEAGMTDDECTFDVVLDIPAGIPAGTYTNTTEELTGSDSGESSVTGPSASGDLIIVGGPRLTKEFIDDPVLPGNQATLRFTLQHEAAAPTSADDITFTDDLSTALVDLSGVGLPLTDLCGPGNGTLTGSAGDELLTFSGGTLAPGASCTFDVTVQTPGTADPGTYTNTTSPVSATVSGVTTTGNPGQDDLNITGLELTKEFINDPVIPGEIVTLRFTIENLHPTLDATSIQFDDPLEDDAGLTLSGSLPTNPCGTGSTLTTFIPSGPPDLGLRLQNGSLDAGSAPCSFDIDLLVSTSTVSNIYNNTTTDFSAEFGGPAIAQTNATDILIVDDTRITLTKEFTDDPVLEGDAANLRFTLTNLDDTNPISSITFTDDLDAALSGLEATGLPVAACGGTVSGTDLISFTGGILTAGETCSFDVTLDVPGSLLPGSTADNTTSEVAGILGGLEVKGDPASDVMIINFIDFSKSFTNNPVLSPGAVNLSFTISNTGGTSGFNQLQFSDDLSAVFPGLEATSLPVNDVCGPGSVLSGTSLLTMTGGNLGPGEDCTFDVDLTVPFGIKADTYTNSTSDLTSNGLPVAGPAADDLEVESLVKFSKSFVPDTIGPSSVSMLTFTIDNTDAVNPVGNLSFTDNLPAGVTVAIPAAATSSCGGIVVAPDGGSTIDFSGGTLAPGFSCQITVNVTSPTPGTYNNTTGDLTSDAGNSGTASADLTVTADRPGFTKNFSPNPVSLGQRSTLTFTIDNSANTSVADELTFTDNLPVGMVVASPANSSVSCIGGLLTAVPGTRIVSYAPDFSLVNDASVSAGSTCTIEVDIVATAAGNLENVTSELLYDGDTESAGKASAVLEVTAGEIHIVKSFVDDPVRPGDMIDLEFTITNFDRDFEATNISFMDILDADLSGLTAVTLPADGFCGAGSTIAGTSTLTMSGGTLPAQGSCTFTVGLQVPGAAMPGNYENISGSVTGEINGIGVTGNMASDLLFISNAPRLTKEFIDDPVASGDNVTLRFTITNIEAGSSLSDISFTDEFDFLPAPISVTLPANAFCGPLSVISVENFGFDIEGLSITGASLAAAGMPEDGCTFDVIISLPPELPSGSYLNQTSEISGSFNSFESNVTGRGAEDTLNVVGAPDLSKVFRDQVVAPGETTFIDFTITFDAEEPVPATDIAFEDDLNTFIPSGVNVLNTPIAAVCGGGMMTFAGGVLSFSGGSLLPGESCFISVEIEIPVTTVPNTYTNNTSTITADIGGLSTIGGFATDNLSVSPLIGVKEFTNDPILPGDTACLEFTLTNFSSTETMEMVTFEDNLENVIAGLTALNLPQADVCGAGSLLELVSGDTLKLSGGTIDPISSCTFQVKLPIAPGTISDTYSNVTTENKATVDGTEFSFNQMFDELEVNATLLDFSKSFSVENTDPGATVDLTFKIKSLQALPRPGDPADVIENIMFDDILSNMIPGLVVAGAPLNEVDVCGSGSSLLSNPAGDVLSLTGGSLTAGDSCKFTVTLEIPLAVADGVFTNTTEPLSGTFKTFTVDGGTASDDLGVNALPDENIIFNKYINGMDVSSGPGPDIAVNSEVTWTYEVINMSSEEIMNVSIFDDKEGMATCPDTKVAPGDTMECTIVGTALPGLYQNNATLNAQSSRSIIKKDTSYYRGLDLIDFTKEFFGDPVNPGAPAILRLTIDYSEVSSASLVDIFFTDDLDATLPGLVATNLPINDACGIGSVISGTSNLIFSGGEMAPGANCVIDVEVLVPPTALPGSYLNTTSNLSGMIDGIPLMEGPATDNLDISSLGFTKEFTDDPVLPGDPVTLKFTISNFDPLLSATDIAFTDNLDDVVAGLAPTGLPMSNVCGPGSLLSATGNELSFNGGNLSPLTSCTFLVTLTVPPGAVASDYPNLTSALTANLGGVPDEISGAEDVLQVIAPVDFTKAFDFAVADPGQTVTLTFDIDNQATTDADALTFNDDIGAFLTGATVLNLAVPQNDVCGTGSSLSLSGDVITLTGGTLAAGTNCSFNVDIQIPAAALAGVYTNTTSNLEGSLGVISFTEAPATDELEISGESFSFIKYTNGIDVPMAPGPDLAVGSTVIWTYELTNNTNEILTDIQVTDDVLGVIACPSMSLAVGGTMTCMATAPATEGSYQNIAIVTGESSRSIEAKDTSYYLGSLMDFGDAPDPTYPTVTASDGAKHITSPLIMGVSIDDEGDGVQDPNASGDDNDGLDDEDGVTFDATPLLIGQINSVSLEASSPGLIDAWIDLNIDGDWDDPNEQILTGEPVVAGLNTLNYSLPATAIGGTTFSRFRLSSTGGLSPTGLASDGEVEDYEVEICNLPEQPTVIVGPTTTCPGLDNVPYEIEETMFATSYIWTFTDNTVVINGQGTNKVTLDGITSSGTLSVLARNFCGDSPTISFDINMANPQLCSLADCTRQVSFIDDPILQLTGSPDIFKAIERIESDATIVDGWFKIFRAGNSIDLYPPFTVEQGAIFIAEIEACANNFLETFEKE